MAHILVVEDDRLVAKFYRLALERAGGYQVTCSENVEEILRLVSSRVVDALILDVSLRDCRYDGRTIDGLDLARLIRGRPDGQELPILLATAHAMQGDRERLLAASGADGYVEKPIYDPQVLIAKLKEIMT
ncbi:MAG TPA: response regulator [Terriglobia bacterium]|nr:response regulator [Terriglobia bacterium]